MYIDGLECSVYDREVFQELRDGGLACVTNTVAFWEDAGETMDEIGRWRDLARENADLITIARTADDIEAAHASGRTAILLGTQNSSPIEDRIRYVELFHDMGLRVMQLTYNNQNAIGGSCYEPHDSGLTRFGREVVREMNRVGMVVDLSHVGERTGIDAIEASEAPVAVTHANARSLYEHARNKGDDLLRALAENGGVIGLATYRNISGPWAESRETWCDMVRRTVDIVGLDHVGIGTDLSRKSGDRELQWMRKGRWTRTTQYGAGSAGNPGKAKPVEFMTSTRDFPALAECLTTHAGFGDEETAKIMGGNWMRFYRHVFKG
ncbi:dipeptidase [Actinoallomurus iriomotensis]|uniref:Membrane dipeptidase n=1 Tax=Actinoallomurus iriomotensis TaxID=478107 RepID=A0A9W6S2G1_9ACTN|nr:membrane dipeptidase [Actinoallomurus iriomotensis]GLY86179.1 membrane dipeptidase [Actinoallomurus iriomotensis]